VANINSLYYPIPLGKLLPGASFATVSIPLYTNLPTNLADGQSSLGAYNEIVLVANSTNLLPLYVCVPLVSGTYVAGAPADTTNWTNVIAIIPAGGSWSRAQNPSWSNKWFLQSYYLSAGNATDYAWGYAGRE
jgi:hypothetical protein